MAKITAEYIAKAKEKPYLSPTETSAITGRSKKTNYEAMGAGELGFLPIGCRSVIEREALDAWMRRGAPR